MKQLNVSRSVFTTTLFLMPFLTLFLISCGAESEERSQSGTADFRCIDNMSMGTYPCSNVDLYAMLEPEELLGERLNDIWGWTHGASGREFAIVGLTDGMTFVEVTDPSNPVVIGKLIESINNSSLSVKSYQRGTDISLLHDDGFKGASIWRDMKVYQHYVFVVSEEEDHGMQIFDLEQLLDIPQSDFPVFFEHDALYLEFGRAHNIAINEETGFAYVLGSMQGETCTDGGMHIVDIRDPLNPQFAGCYLDERSGGVVADGYIHDTQCVIYNGPDSRYLGKEICFNSSELKFLITDVTDKSDPSTISIAGYDGAAYSHQGWLTEDHRYFLMNDEFDEIEFGHPTRTYIWNVEDLEEPELVGFHQHSTNAVDHNLYIRGEYVYQGNYLAGLRILTLTDPGNATLEETGYFNTTPDENGVEFGGVWSVYPWLSDNKVLATDVHNGLFIFRFNGGN